jgi:hypothetical protein
MEKSHMGMGDGDGGLRQNRYMGCNVYRMVMLHLQGVEG